MHQEQLIQPVSLAAPSSFVFQARGVPVRAADVDHRQALAAFVLQQADAWYREDIRYSYRLRNEFNETYCAGKRLVCYLMFATPGSPGALADYQLGTLVTAAQTFARTWPDKAQEAAACFLHTSAHLGVSLVSLQRLFAAATALVGNFPGANDI